MPVEIWIFPAFLAASILHMVEEFFFPGGFIKTMQKMNPRFGRFATIPAAAVINGLQILLCVAVILIGRGNLAFSLSVAVLLFINGLMHIGAAARLKGYAPGVLTGLVFYLPLSIFSFYYFLSTGDLKGNDIAVAAGLGILYQVVPLGYFLVMTAVTQKV
jgi:hypothetical protein